MTANEQTATDNYYMMLAIEEAKKGIYRTRPNPAVGCVIVNNGLIVGAGFHPKAGEPHAEVFALRQAKQSAKGATAYVTLEPCSHTGKTPPCARALIESGISRVVIAGLDPNPQVAGRGVTMLKEAGIAVTVGIGSSQAEQLNLGFLKAMRTQMPYVRLKIATSLDGRTAMASGESKWITGPAAREDVQKLRALSGAIITGSQTVIDDNPSLNVRSTQLGVDVEQVPQPKVVVLDRRGRLQGADYQVLQRQDTLIWSQSDLTQLLQTLVSEYQIYDVLVEAGSEVAGSFVEAGRVDELVVYQAPCVLGDKAKPMLTIAMDHLAAQRRFDLLSATPIGEDLKLIYRPYSERLLTNK
ncbi:bifunctional diaminohydroxyphosphoribosylaminopyrimidine deaminase/5-amino-6-(5-phosphoribosylamino)uracil reductase RibD [Psychrobacter sp. FDAARGOS_221]|uniref:bifunctional diaminohydroxyphosphoribosylaminopyrimidine deaminase/5-amino-6-(5-phosphoribosylamino)uracil reductase RibD n=1 Tax=Psychrobacter sp. FDAARGOS_221 TaxID=1975705 RepID=UPI000BB53881|nr:bifunctional diaminohydroxyphosphoribosylaminopyrimidine deaminase/5-amino-6-(5-phosphoribosylamino)uracil reductase RibD [Psychrobacter sp. FDAARGOS_221]PNK60760.1 bifunctional diaminohydroxyphosphoribosylaminopyrimidine deaminase/5-amino-6-(5-phosphoribosylamino)uracil reductase RibD [Psychrobacter sp. FDAARGOS_221]